MYKKIYIALDNSTQSNFGIDVGIKMAKEFGSSLIGSHVYAASLHDVKFKQMEGGLPEKYKEEEELFKQREVHDSLIDKGLQVITESFLDVFEKKCKAGEVNFSRRSLEGKNFQVLVDDIKEADYDLVILGALGLGAVKDSIIGSVCERVVRRINTDLIVIRDVEPLENNKKIVVAVDGSPQAFAGLKTALNFAKSFDVKIDVISAFDPYFHYVAFTNIADVLSSEAAEIFKFQEQEKLHEEIIDSGLAKIYQNHLDTAKIIAEKEGVEVSTKLLAGKAFEQVLKYVRETKPWMLVVGRIGVHSEGDMDVGNNTENLLRLVKCNLLISSTEFMIPHEELDPEATIPWTKETEQRMDRIPSFAKGMAAKAVYEYAIKNGYSLITSEVVDKVMENLLPQSAKMAMGMVAGVADGKDVLPAAEWAEDGDARVKELYPENLLDSAKLKVEKFARVNGNKIIDKSIVDKVLTDKGHDL